LNFGLQIVVGGWTYSPKQSLQGSIVIETKVKAMMTEFMLQSLHDNGSEVWTGLKGHTATGVVVILEEVLTEDNEWGRLVTLEGSSS